MTPPTLPSLAQLRPAVHRLARWFGPLSASLLLLATLLALAFQTIRMEHGGGGLSGMMGMALRYEAPQAFIRRVAFGELLPIYIGAGLIAWVLFLALSRAIPTLRGFLGTWTLGDGFSATWALLGALHLGLWWQVPTTLWVLPFLNRLPFWLLFPLLAWVLVLPWYVLAIRRQGRRRGLALGTLALGLGLVLAQVPGWIGAWIPSRPPAPGGQAAPTRILMLAVDGLRRDTALAQGLTDLKGTHLTGMVAPVPATRMIYSLLWGGDPMRYTSSVVIPDLEELQGKVPLPLLAAAQRQGWKTRFFIDDAGTIGIMGRGASFDEVGMPAAGWESFLDSNFGAYVPLYASWLNRLRTFPGTHPWSGPEEGLRVALERGRGADWVMYHACVAHQPIFLTRQELSRLGRWWTLSPADYKPLPSAKAYRPGLEHVWDSRMDPKRAYEIRIQSVLKAWVPILNGLATDPQYGEALRVFFSDHGEHFFRFIGDIRLQGVHGFHPDPIELGVPFVLSGPGLQEGRVDDRPRTLLAMRSVIQGALQPGWSPAAALRALEPVHPIHFRYVVPDLEEIMPMAKTYRVSLMSEMVKDVFIGKGGFWGMSLDTQVDDRVKAPCVGTLDAEGRMIIYKPLKDGGAHRLEYHRDKFIRDDEVDEATYEKARDAAVAYVRGWTLSEDIKEEPLIDIPR